MQLSSAPSKITLPFAQDGDRNAIPVASSSDPGVASYTDGFPPDTMIPWEDGGIAPSGLDFNGILFYLSALTRWQSAGAGFAWDSSFATDANIGGYPKGARVLRADGSGYWLSLVDNNVTNPDAGGAGWVIDGIKPFASAVATGQVSYPLGTNKVQFNTTEFDSWGLWDSVNNRFVARYAGKYRINAHVYIITPDPQGPFILQIAKNGSLTKLGGSALQVSDSSISMDVNAIVQGVINDYFDIQLVVPQTTVAVGPGASNEKYVYFQIEYLGA